MDPLGNLDKMVNIPLTEMGWMQVQCIGLFTFWNHLHPKYFNSVHRCCLDMGSKGNIWGWILQWRHNEHHGVLHHQRPIFAQPFVHAPLFIFKST